MALQGHEINDMILPGPFAIRKDNQYAEFLNFMKESKVSFVRVDFKMWEPFVNHPWASAALVSQIRAIDSIVLQGDNLVPQLAWPQIFKTYLITETRTLNTKQAAYIVGAGPLSRMTAAVMFQLGFKQLRMIHHDLGALEQDLKILRRALLGLDMDFVEISKVTQQGLQGSLLVICEDLTEKKDLKADLAYYNFMSNDGIVVDLRNWEPNNVLAEEAHRAGLKAFLPSKFWPRYEHHWIKMQKINLSFADIQMAWPI